MTAKTLLASLLSLMLIAGASNSVSAGDSVETKGDNASRIAELEKEVGQLKKDKEELLKKLTELEKRIAKLEKGGEADAKPTKNFEEAMAQLDISDAEKSAIRDSVKKCKKQQLETLEVPTKDKRIPAEEIIDCFIKMQKDAEGAQAELQKLFLYISTEKIPGDEKKRTYLQAIEEYKKANRETISKILSKADQRRLDEIHHDWSEFELGEDDPWTELYVSRMNKK